MSNNTLLKLTIHYYETRFPALCIPIGNWLYTLPGPRHFEHHIIYREVNETYAYQSFKPAYLFARMQPTVADSCRCILLSGPICLSLFA